MRVADADAFRWADKAAGRGHPFALYNLGRGYLLGEHGCHVNLPKARSYLDKASCFGIAECQIDLLVLADRYKKMRTPEALNEAESILSTLLNDQYPCFFLAQSKQASVRFLKRDYVAAYEYSSLSVMNSEDACNSSASLIAYMASQNLGNHAQGKVWCGKVDVRDIHFDTVEQKKVAIRQIIDYRRELRQLRDICGGCGAEFEGKDRKFCRGCRAFCYCSRECQKVHWNRKTNGHREDCLGLKDVKQKLKEAANKCRLLSD